MELDSFVYKHLTDNFELQYYLRKNITPNFQKLLCKIRISCHPLAVETGRYSNTPRAQRLCPLCKSDIEDEYHFLLICPAYDSVRTKFIKQYFVHRPSVFKAINLLSTNNCKNLINIGKFINKALEIRTLFINS